MHMTIKAGFDSHTRKLPSNDWKGHLFISDPEREWALVADEQVLQARELTDQD